MTPLTAGENQALTKGVHRGVDVGVNALDKQVYRPFKIVVGYVHACLHGPLTAELLVTDTSLRVTGPAIHFVGHR